MTDTIFGQPWSFTSLLDGGDTGIGPLDDDPGGELEYLRGIHEGLVRHRAAASAGGAVDKLMEGQVCGRRGGGGAPPRGIDTALVIANAANVGAVAGCGGEGVRSGSCEANNLTDFSGEAYQNLLLDCLDIENVDGAAQGQVRGGGEIGPGGGDFGASLPRGMMTSPDDATMEVSDDNLQQGKAPRARISRRYTPVSGLLNPGVCMHDRGEDCAGKQSPHRHQEVTCDSDPMNLIRYDSMDGIDSEGRVVEELLASDGSPALVATSPPKRSISYAPTSVFLRYEGGMLDGQRHGEGVMQYRSGHEYRGSWRRDKFHGVGTFYFVDDRRISGVWNDGKRTADMLLTFPDGRVFEGES